MISLSKYLIICFNRILSYNNINYYKLYSFRNNFKKDS